MPRVCSICTHEQRAPIDHALIAGEALRDIARQWRVSKDAVARHKADHLPAHLKQAKDVETVAAADDLLTKVKAIEVEAKRIARKTERKGDLRTVMASLRELARLIELLARLRGAGQGSHTVVNILVTPQWHALRTTIVAALAPFPEARAAVLTALHESRGNGYDYESHLAP
jgi:hypothetical protein